MATESASALNVKTYLFVYGTLRQQANHPMHRALARYASYAGMGRFQGKLYDLGPYPAAVGSTRHSHHVIGDIYQLRRATQSLKVLDDYEGALFRRRRVLVYLEGGEAITAWIYLYSGSLEGATLIPSGDYLDVLKRR